MDQATARRREFIAGILGKLPARQQLAVAERAAGVRRGRRGDPRQPVAGGPGGAAGAAARRRRGAGARRQHGAIMTDARQGAAAGAAPWAGRAAGWLRGSRGGLFASRCW